MNEKELRKKYIEAAESAPEVVFSNGAHRMTTQEVKAKVIDYYKQCGEEDLTSNEIRLEEFENTMDSEVAMAITLRADALNLSLISEAAVMANYYAFLNEIQEVRNIEAEEDDSCDMHSITIYDCKHNTVIVEVQEGYKSAACLMAHGALITWMDRQRRLLDGYSMIIVEQGECEYHVVDRRKTKFRIEEHRAFGRDGYDVIATIPGDEGHDNGGDWEVAWYTDKEQAEASIEACISVQCLKAMHPPIYQFPIDMPGAYTGKLELYPEDGYNPYYDRYHPKVMGRCKNCQMKKYGIGLKEE